MLFTFSRGRELLHLCPGSHKGPARHDFFEAIRVRGARPMDKVEVDVVGVQLLKRLVQPLPQRAYATGCAASW